MTWGCGEAGEPEESPCTAATSLPLNCHPHYHNAATPLPCCLQPAPPARSRDRFVSLPDELQGEQPQGLLPDVTPTIFEARWQGCCVGAGS